MQMKYLRLLLLATLVAQAGYAQRVNVGLFGGIGAYAGDLTSNMFPRKVTNGVIGLTANYPVNSHFSFRSGLTYTVLGGADRYADDPSRIRRNLSFETSLVELSLVGEFYLLDIETFGVAPYAFGGAALFHFNPYAFDTNGDKVFLRPLCTEGQGLSAYPDRKPYSLLQVAIPYGAGIKFAVNDRVRIGFELGFRKLFTEYLDDVSTEYVRWEDILEAKGQKAVDMAFRGDELEMGFGNSSIPYPEPGFQRGDPSGKDTYYFTGINLNYFFNSYKGNNAYYGKHNGRKGRLGCPTNVY